MEATAERMALELKGNVLAIEVMFSAMTYALPDGMRLQVLGNLDIEADRARTMLVHALVSDTVRESFEAHVVRYKTILQ
jgi:hypothetical protein